MDVRPVADDTARAAAMYVAHVDAIFGYVARRIGRDLAADVVADVFRIAMERLDNFDESRGSERSWLFGIATNQVRRHWRTESRRLRAMSRVSSRPTPTADPLLRVVERLDAATDADRLLDAVADLDGEDRDLLVLIAWEGLSYRAVAHALEIPVGTVRSRLHRIRRTLHDVTSDRCARHREDENSA